MKRKIRNQVSDRSFGRRNGRNHRREETKESESVPGLLHLELRSSGISKQNQHSNIVAKVDYTSAGNVITYKRRKKSILNDNNIVTYRRRGRSPKDKETHLVNEVAQRSLPGDLGVHSLTEASPNDLGENSVTEGSKRTTDMETKLDISERQSDQEICSRPDDLTTDSRAKDLMQPVSPNGVIKTYQRKTSFKNTLSPTHALDCRSTGNLEDDSLETTDLNGLGRTSAFEEDKKVRSLASLNEKGNVANLDKYLSLLNISRGQSEPGNLHKPETLVENSKAEHFILPSALTGATTSEGSLNFIRDSAEQAVPPLPERVLSGHAKRKLLILDINGLLADIVADVRDGRKPDTIVSRKAVFRRPFCEDFLLFCFDRFDVGVWSSRIRKNVDRALDFLMGNLKDKLLFCWDQSHCTQTEFNTIENREKPLVLKELKRLWQTLERDLSPEKGKYNESNTLLIDDSPYKALRNPAHTAIFPHSFSYQDVKDSSLGPGGDLRVFLERLEKADNVQKFVQLNPFGQQAISESDPFWDFYSKIIDSSS